MSTYPKSNISEDYISALMLTYPKSAIRVRHMPMHLSSGHVTLVTRKFYSTSNFHPVGLKAPGGLTLGFAPNF